MGPSKECASGIATIRIHPHAAGRKSASRPEGGIFAGINRAVHQPGGRRPTPRCPGDRIHEQNFIKPSARRPQARKKYGPGRIPGADGLDRRRDFRDMLGVLAAAR